MNSLLKEFDFERSEWGKITFRHAIAEWCLRNAKSDFRRNELEGSLRWNSLAAYTAGLDCMPLVYPELESNLIRIASSIPIPPVEILPTRDGRTRYLHVLSGAYPYGGHTAMVWRWIEMDSTDNCHSVMLLHQKLPVPEKLANTINKSGGEVIVLDHKASLCKKAEELRKYAYQMADVVVLSISESDVVPSVAFGVEGGPPVLLVNQVAHLCWVGAAIVDFVLNVRGSDKELEWTSKYRSIAQNRSLCLPIPLIRSRNDVSNKSKETAKINLGLPSGSKLVLTVGNSFKYKAIEGIDFLGAALQIVNKDKDVFILVVGVDEDENWKDVYQKSEGRIRAVGRKYDLLPYHAAADLYIEGFPYGSTTALLEAGLYGIPCVLAPNICPPPFTSDGIALDNLKRPTDIADYVMTIVNLLQDQNKRNLEGLKIQNDVASVHCGSGWLGYLDRVKQRIPQRHNVYNLTAPPPVDKYYGVFWSAFLATFNGEDFLRKIYRLALHFKLSPRIDRSLLHAVKKSNGSGNMNTVLKVSLYMVCHAAIIFPGLINKTPLIDKLYYYLRVDGKIMRYLSKLGLIRSTDSVKTVQKRDPFYTKLKLHELSTPD